MKIKEQHDVGVIVGRFQVPELHEAHKRLIQAVCAQHSKVVIFLGLSPLMVTQENPLDFEARKQMILQEFPDVNVLYIKDVGSDQAWVKRLDEMIEDVTTPAQSVVLYGGRDSFIKHYVPYGRHDTRELEADVYVSGSAVRRQVSRSAVKASPDFRAGVVWAAYSTFPTVYTCVDIALVKSGKILLGRKQHEEQLRLPGGFATPESPSFEHDAARELEEETGAVVRPSQMQYLGSFQVDDWRYKNERDKIKTLLFLAEDYTGSIRAADDLAEVRVVEIAALDIDSMIVTNHRPLVRAATLNA